jgi:two-component system phosphate regulon sensor histidine kinase PhoR
MTGERLGARALIVAAVAGALEAAVVLPFMLLSDPPATPLTALAILIAVVAAIVGGLVPGIVAAVVGLACVALAAGELTQVALALPAALVAVLAVAWASEVLARSEDERARAVDQLAAVGEVASAGALSIDRDGAVTGWSAGAEELYGVDSDELEGAAVSDLLASQTTDDVESLLEDVRKGRTVSTRVGETTLVARPVRDSREGVNGAVLVAIDDRERRRLHEEASNVRTKYGALVRLLPVVTYLCKPQDRSPIFVSPSIEQLLGYTPAEWVEDGGLSARLVHQEDRERVVAAAAEAARTESPFKEEYRMLTRDGRVVWLRDESATVRGEAGEALCIQGYLRDITAEKREEEEREDLRRAEQTAIRRATEHRGHLKLLERATGLLGSSLDYDASLKEVAELLVENMADWCIVDIADDSGTLSRSLVVHAEPLDSKLAAERAPVAEPDDVAGRVIRERKTELLPDPGAASAPADKRPVVSGIEAESYVCVPMLTRRGPVGALTLIAARGGRRFGADDRALAEDVARRAALSIENARLHGEVEQRSDAAQVLTHVADGVFLLDHRGVFRLLNPAAEAMTGLNDDEVVGHAAAEVIPGWDAIAERIPIARSPEPAQAETVPFETVKGERWFSIAGVNFFGGTVYAFRDVSEDRRLDELKAEFVATASHELRTPLAAVYGAAQTLRRHDFALDETGRERFISLISEESERLSRIVNDILLANQLDAGRLDLESEPFDAGELVERVVEATRLHLPPGAAALEVSVPASPPAVAADRDKARQVLVNLVENAIKYSPDGGRVVVGAETGKTSVRFFVSDEGMGIPEQELERIFDKFYRLDPEMTRGIRGTGLGLYICSELVRRMGGRIWVTSTKGEGSEFSFELPLSEASMARVASTPELRSVSS